MPLFEYPFMERAALEVALLSPIAGLIGAQIVLRRLAFYAHAVGAATFPGLVLAGPAGIPPTLAALCTGTLFAGALERLGRLSRERYDSATALLLVGALATGIVLASDVFESTTSVDQLLFGSLLAIGTDELRLTSIALGLVIAIAVMCRRRWVAKGFDPDSARSLGLDRSRSDWALVFAIALSVVAAIDAVGALLVSAILVVPALTASLFARSVRQLELGAASIAFGEGIASLLVAFELDVPPGAAAGVLSGVIFAVAAGARALAQRPRRIEAAA